MYSTFSKEVLALIAAALAALALMLLASMSVQAAAILRDSAVVEGDTLTIGDLFDNAGAKADTVIAPAPKIGRPAVYDALWLANLARQYDIDWRPASQNDHVTVERAGRVITVSEVEDVLRAAVRDYFEKQGAGRKVRVSLDNRQVPLYAAPGAYTDLQVRSLWMDRSGDRFTATVAASSDPSADVVKVSGRTYEVTTIPVLNRRLGSDEVVRASDLRFKDVRSDLVDPDVITDADAVIGLSPRRYAADDVPLKAGDFRPPVVVSKGSLVSMVVQTPYMMLTAQGRAAEDGAMGDVIRVMNTQSKTTVDAVVDGPSRVVVRTLVPRAQANAGPR